MPERSKDLKVWGGVNKLILIFLAVDSIFSSFWAIFLYKTFKNDFDFNHFI